VRKIGDANPNPGRITMSEMEQEGQGGQGAPGDDEE
jgi:hypothetical protein